MKLYVDRLKASPEPYVFETTAGWWEERARGEHELPHSVVEPFVFSLRAHTMGEDILIEGEVEGAIEIECSRCLERYRQPIRDTFRLVLEPAAGRVPDDPEGALALSKDGLCLGDELEAGWYRGKELELDAYLFEVVSLSMPVKPLCREDCPGLCAHCGRNLAHGGCDCEDYKPESPFAVLAALKGSRAGPEGEGPEGRGES